MYGEKYLQEMEVNEGRQSVINALHALPADIQAAVKSRLFREWKPFDWGDPRLVHRDALQNAAAANRFDAIPNPQVPGSCLGGGLGFGR